MLKQLSIQNYALIRQLDIQPSKGLNIITGETGAGKSIMLGAIGLLLGNRADSKVLFDEDQKCFVEGIFDITGYALNEIFEEEDIDFDTTCIIRREITPNGKSRAFINDTPARVETLKRVMEVLMDIHSQHDTLLLGSNLYQTQLLDAYAGNTSLVATFKEQFKTWKKAEKFWVALKEGVALAQKELDYNFYLLKELEEVKLQSGEQETLEEELRLLENAEEIKTKLNYSIDLLNNSEQAVNSNLKAAVVFLDQLTKFSTQYATLKDRANSAFLELKDIVAELEDLEGAIEVSPEKIEVVSQRLSVVYKLQQKHQVKTIEALLAIEADLREKVGAVLNLEDQINEAAKAVTTAFDILIDSGKVLSIKRTQAIPAMEAELKTLLADLGMKEAYVNIKQETIEPSANGADKISFLFTANKGVAPQELKTAASGGEFSRLMLAMKYILADKMAMPTIIFDEIDTGISGEIAIKVGKLMKQMTDKHQIICISHMPQMASQAEAHYYVYKDHSSDRTVSKVKLLTNEERISEIAQMIGGDNPSESAVQSARELIGYQA
jgi:DNA repair protein RecN (Recombination protein N)